MGKFVAIILSLKTTTTTKKTVAQQKPLKADFANKKGSLVSASGFLRFLLIYKKEGSVGSIISDFRKYLAHMKDQAVVSWVTITFTGGTK